MVQKNPLLCGVCTNGGPRNVQIDGSELRFVLVDCCELSLSESALSLK